MAKKANTGFNRLLTPSDELAEIVGDKPLPRTEVTKKLWKYIKAKGLQDDENRRAINPDAKLAGVLGKKQIDMFKMTKKVAEHLS